MRLPIGGRGRFALSVLKRWGLPVQHKGQGNCAFHVNEGQLHWLLYDGHREWRRRHKLARHSEEEQKVLNSDWDLVKRSFRRRGITLHA